MGACFGALPLSESEKMEKRYMCYANHREKYEIKDRGLTVATVDDPALADKIVTGLNMVEDKERIERQNRALDRSLGAYPGFGWGRDQC